MKNITIRQRVIFSSILCTFFFLIVTTPALDFIIDVLRPPEPLPGIETVRSIAFGDVADTEDGAEEEGTEPRVINTAEVRWNNVISEDINSVEIYLDDEQLTTDDGESNLITINEISIKRLDPTNSYTLTFITEDLTGRTNTTELEMTLLENEDGSALNSKVFRANTDIVPESTFSRIVQHTSIFMPIVLLSTLWIMSFKINNAKAIAVFFYPAAILFPYMFVSLSFLYNTSTLATYISSVVLGALFFVVSYLLFLTTNILNASIYTTLPLEQAAKAAQFVFSLIAFYLTMILFFGADSTIWEKLIWILPFVFYYSFSSIIMLKGIPATTELVLAKTFSITLSMAFAVFVLSLWPVNYIFGMLSIAVFYYVILSIALEVRFKISKNIWVEYVILVSLILLLLLVNSTWGINGGIFS